MRLVARRLISLLEWIESHRWASAVVLALTAVVALALVPGSERFVDLLLRLLSEAR